MPIYDYHCQSCNKKFEVYVIKKDSDMIMCPNCKSNDVIRLMSTFTPIFHGSGFYQTDYVKKSNKEK